MGFKIYIRNTELEKKTSPNKAQHTEHTIGITRGSKYNVTQ